MNASDIRTLYAYNRWANLRIFSVLEKLSEQQFTAGTQSSFPSIRESVFHILAAEWIWLKRWKGEPPRASQPVNAVSWEVWKGVRSGGEAPPQQLSTVAELRAFCDAIEQERQQYLQGLSDAEVQAVLSYTDLSGKPNAQPLGQLMQHVANHGTYHRGQVTTLLRQAGAQTIGLDMVLYFREQGQQKTS
ncbi:MAG TPA: DinB family protein [Terriglobales bacterium]|nr:DinB family protein [Terriglobales bacterium]